MAYIGKQPTVGNFVKLDAITATATTTFNLLNGGVAYFPQSPNHCLVSLNGILQAPTDSFTISGSTIIFSSALTTSDVIDFIIVLGDVLNIGTPSDNTVSLAKLTATGTKDATTFLRGDNTFATAGGTNTPAFLVTTTTSISVGGGASTKIIWNTETFDTDSAFDNATNYRFTVPSGKAGKYIFFACNAINGSISGRTSQLRVYKNGSYDDTRTYNVTTWGTAQVSLINTFIYDLSVGDYLETYIYSDNDAGKTTVTNSSGVACFWYGFKLL
jgi:hypothetical protein